jgi:hypothetical protein
MKKRTETIIKRVIGTLLALLILPCICGGLYHMDHGIFWTGFLIGIAVTGIVILYACLIILICWLFDIL